MKRILMMLALAAFLVAALSVSALSAFAAPNCADLIGSNPNCVKAKPNGNTNGGDNNKHLTPRFKPER
jgi:hypothetical protein